MFVAYFFGCWWLPAALILLDFDVVKLGKQGDMMSAAAVIEEGEEEAQVEGLKEVDDAKETSPPLPEQGDIKHPDSSASSNPIEL